MKHLQVRLGSFFSVKSMYILPVLLCCCSLLLLRHSKANAVSLHLWGMVHLHTSAALQAT